MPDFTFEKVIPTDNQVAILYDLLNKREHCISHKESVALEDHKQFVHHHPYRDWFLIRSKENLLGSFYLSQENTIGINVLNFEDIKLLSKILLYVKNNYQPLDAIPSVRSGEFAVNVSPTNHHLARALTDLGAELAQLSYYLPQDL